MVKRLSPEAGHAFDFLPVGDAIHWLAAVASTDSAVLAEFAAKHAKGESWRDVGAAVKRARALGVEDQLRVSISAFEAAAEEDAANHLNAIQSNTDGSWIDDYLQWHDQFAVSDAASPVIEAYMELHASHSKEASRLESEAKKAFREKRTDEGWNKYLEIIENQYASPQYRTLVDSVKKHFEAN